MHSILSVSIKTDKTHCPVMVEGCESCPEFRLYDEVELDSQVPGTCRQEGCKTVILRPVVIRGKIVLNLGNAENVPVTFHGASTTISETSGANLCFLSLLRRPHLSPDLAGESAGRTVGVLLIVRQILSSQPDLYLKSKQSQSSNGLQTRSIRHGSAANQKRLKHKKEMNGSHCKETWIAAPE